MTVHPKKLRFIEDLIILLFISLWIMGMTYSIEKSYKGIIIGGLLILIIIPLFKILLQKNKLSKNISKKYLISDLVIKNDEIYNKKTILNYKVELDSKSIKLYNYFDLKTVVFYIDKEKKQLIYKPYKFLNINCKIKLIEIVFFELTSYYHGNILIFTTIDETIYNTIHLFQNTSFSSNKSDLIDEEIKSFLIYLNNFKT